MSTWQQQDAGEGQIYLIRNPAYSAGAVAFIVKIDGAERARIMPNEQLRLPVAPGDHRIQLTMWSRQGSETLFFHVPPGGQVAFSCQGSMHPLRPIALKREDEADGAVVSGYSPEPASHPFSDAAAYAPQAPFGTAPSFGEPPAFAPPPVAASVGPAAPQPSFGAPPAQEPAVVEVRETGQFEEPLGEEMRTIDNRRSATGITRSVKASREWSRTLTVGDDRKRSYGAELSGGPAWIKAKGSIEAELQRTYSMESGARHVFEEEISITVPAHTAVQIQLRWKRIWQRGVVVLRQTDGTTSEIPYQVVVNVTFDQTLSDTDAEIAAS